MCGRFVLMTPGRSLAECLGCVLPSHIRVRDARISFDGGRSSDVRLDYSSEKLSSEAL
jgi:hypothetical protein